MNRRGNRILPAVALLLAFVPAPDALRADELLAHGTDEMFWVARGVPPEPRSRQAAQRTLVRARAVGTDDNWTTIAQLGSRVISLANRGTELAALLESGSWMLLWSGGSSMGSLPADGASLLVLGSDAETIWAIGAGGRIVATTTATTTPTTQPDNQVPRGDLALYTLERGRWQRKSWLDPDITLADVPRLSMAVVKSNPIISILRFGGSIETIRWDENGLERIESLPAADARQIKLLSDGQRAVLWAAPESGAGRLYFLARSWSEPTALEMNDPPRAGEPRTIALANNIRLLFIRDRKILEQTYDRTGTTVRTDAVALPAPPAQPDATPNRILTLAAAAMLMIVVIGSLRRGGGAAPASAALSAGLTPAPLLSRILAGLIDALPLIVPCWFIFRGIDPSSENVDSVIAATSWPFYSALAGYLIYNWAFEALFARTIGKMLFGLRVSALDGSRPTQVALLARNALRLVDVTMLAVPLVLVVLSPLRQRVGDIAARTVVVSGAGRSVSDDSEVKISKD